MEQKNKLCPHCKMDVNPKATRCPHCHGKIIRVSKAGKIAAGVLGFFFILIIALGSGSDAGTPQAEAPQTPEIGEDGYLRLSGITDPEQVICLGETEEDYDKVGKALLANDFIGLLEIPGAFCVSNGTKVKVIDQALYVRRVRIMEDVREVDSDKVLRTGWVAMEFVVSQ